MGQQEQAREPRGLVVDGRVVGDVVNPNDDGHCWTCDGAFVGAVIVTRGVAVCSHDCRAAAEEAIAPGAAA